MKEDAEKVNKAAPLLRGIMLPPQLDGFELQQIAGLALQKFADLLQRLEAYAFHSAGFQKRQIGFRDPNIGGEFL